MSASVCLYCKRSNRQSTSVEHVFPESLGNAEIVLPKGTVCDSCNNGKLSRLDIYTKAGKLPSAAFPEVEFSWPERGRLHAKTTRGDMFKTEWTRPDGWTKFSFSFKGRNRMDANYLTRGHKS